MNPPTLLEVQRWMKSHIRAGEVPAPAGAEGPAFNLQRGSPGEARLAVYAEGYLARTREALTEVYEALEHVVGPRRFGELAQAYAERYPSRDYNLSFAGRHLPAFLTTSPLTQELPFLPDLARLEWLVNRAFHAVQQPPLDPSRLASLSLEDWDPARLIFQQAVGLVASAWPILDIWGARTRPVSEVQIDIVNRPQRALIFRQGVEVRCEPVDERQSVLLEGLLAGRTFGTVCQELAERETCQTPSPDAGDEGEKASDTLAASVNEWFARWVRAGLIVRCELP